MNRRIPILLLSAALLALPGVARAQLWVESRTASNLTFAFRGLDSLGVLTASNQAAGARFSLTFDSGAKTLRMDVTNLSGGTYTVGTGAGQQLAQFGNGTLMGFGFQTNPDNLTASAFSAWANAAFNAPGHAGTDTVGFLLAQDYNLSGGGSSNPFYMDVGTATSGNLNANGGNPAPGLAAGYGASFLFTFDTPAFSAAKFNPLDFFFNDSDPATYDMSFRFQQTSGLGGTDDEGSDKVAVAFHLEEDLQVPEPSTYGLLGAAALLGLVVTRRLRRR